MPKTKISEFSAIPGNNTDIDGINIAEGCPPSGINDAIRELMSQLKDFQAGTAGDSFNGPIGTTTPAAGVFTNLSASGTFALTGDQVQISEGGTGQTTANAAFNALAPSQSTHAGKYLKTDGTNTSWDALDISTADITGTLPIANGGTGLTALGTGVQTALGQNVTGSGGIVLASSPSLTTPNLGTPSAVTLTNATGLPLSTGVTGTLATTNGGTGLTSFTANGVVYASSTSALTTGSALTFNGTVFGVTGSAQITTTSGIGYLEAYGGSSFKIRSSGTMGVESGAGSAVALLGDTLVNFLIGGSEQMRLTSTGLGIGTSSPATKLDVAGTKTLASDLGVTNIRDTASLAAGNGGAIVLMGKYNSGGSYVGGAYVNASKENATDGNYSYALTFGTNVNGGALTERMRLDSSGRLGLGVTPTGSWNFQIASSSASARIRLQNSSTGSADADGGGIQMEGVNLVLQNSESGYVSWEMGASNTERMRLDSSGNLGLGVTPSAWAGLKGLQVADSTMLAYAGVNGYVGSNSYYGTVGGSGFKYYGNGLAALYAQEAGVHKWFTAPSGTAGNAISFTQAMTLDASGNLLLNTTSNSGGHRLVVSQTNASGVAAIHLPVDESTILGPTANTNITMGSNLYVRASSVLGFSTNNAERARITSGGDVGIGTSSPSYKLHVSGSGTITSAVTSSSAGAVLRLSASGGFDQVIQYTTTSGAGFAINDATAGVNRVYITSGGDFLVAKTTSALGTAGFEAKTTGETYCTRSGDTPLHINRTTSTGALVGLYYAGAVKGTISTDGSNVAYNTSSDYRLKDNPQPLTGSGAFIDALKPKTWIWKETGATGVGFIAHEVQEVSPASVTGTKDAVDEEGKPIMQAMEYGSAEFIANIIAELQSLRARVAQLEAK